MTALRIPRGWRARLPLLVLVLAVVVAVSLLATAGAEGTLTYYRTPSELLAAPSSHQVRLGGLVVDGSIHRHDGTVRFALTDGKQQVEVVSRTVPPQTFRAGQGAVVNGTLDDRGVFEARSVVVRHDNQYEPSEMLDH
ncbi:cytochrome c maturation protein CcmE [Nocardioides sp. DS6]|uniref:Cytochrome c maturation protein CcmE n=1 Tax=Nocardioides eburneus TaxID=3231482 RepID=A0ABV3T295_9ACTN